MTSQQSKRSEQADVPDGDNFAERGRVSGLKAVAVEDAVVKGVAGVGTAAVHGEAVPYVFENLGIEGPVSTNRSARTEISGGAKKASCSVRGEAGKHLRR